MDAIIRAHWVKRCWAEWLFAGGNPGGAAPGQGVEHPAPGYHSAEIAGFWPRGVDAMPRWRPARLLQLTELDEQLTRLAERLREHRGHPEDELLLRCHIDMLLDERLSHLQRVAAPS
jgi:hypothetical protein